MDVLKVCITGFDYTFKERQDQVLDVYETVKEVQRSHHMEALIIAVVVVLVAYLAFISIAWWIERKGIIPGVRLFKIVTFGVGNVEKINGGKHLAIFVFIMVGLIMIITGYTQEIILTVFVKTIQAIGSLFKLLFR